MLPIRWDPFIKDLSRFHRDIDDTFRRSFGLSWGDEDAVFTPSVNTYTKENQFCIEAEIPGVDKEDLDVSVEGDALILRGERKMSKETEEENYFIRESRYGSFLRRLPLPEGADSEKVEASYENGVLKITMPIEQKAITGRKIEIQAPEKRGKTREGKEAEQQHH
jgi:HSP20 family protein